MCNENCTCNKDGLSNACRIQSQMVVVECLRSMLDGKPSPKKSLNLDDLNKVYGWLDQQLKEAKKRLG